MPRWSVKSGRLDGAGGNLPGFWIQTENAFEMIIIHQAHKMVIRVNFHKRNQKLRSGNNVQQYIANINEIN
jgi:hypothetical protein